jgi:hypothetical protein
MVNLLELAVTVPAASAGENDADRVYCPAVSIDSPLKVATPATAATVAVPARVPAPDDVVNVTDADAESTSLPPSSMKDTHGWVAMSAHA